MAQPCHRPNHTITFLKRMDAKVLSRVGLSQPQTNNMKSKMPASQQNWKRLVSSPFSREFTSRFWAFTMKNSVVFIDLVSCVGPPIALFLKHASYQFRTHCLRLRWPIVDESLRSHYEDRSALHPYETVNW